MVAELVIFGCACAGMHACLWLYMLVPSVLDTHTSGLLLAAVDTEKSSASVATVALGQIGLDDVLAFAFVFSCVKLPQFSGP